MVLVDELVVEEVDDELVEVVVEDDELVGQGVWLGVLVVLVGWVDRMVGVRRKEQQTVVARPMVEAHQMVGVHQMGQLMVVVRPMAEAHPMVLEKVDQMGMVLPMARLVLVMVDRMVLVHRMALVGLVVQTVAAHRKVLGKVVQMVGVHQKELVDQKEMVRQTAQLALGKVDRTAEVRRKVLPMVQVGLMEPVVLMVVDFQMVLLVLVMVGRMVEVHLKALVGLGVQKVVDPQMV